MHQALASALRVLLSNMDRSVACRFGATGLLAMIIGALTGLAPLALKEMVDACSQASGHRGMPPGIAAAGAAYLLCQIASRLLTEFRPWLASTAEQRLFAHMRQQYFERLLELPFAFHLQKTPTELVQALQQAVSGFQIIVFSLFYNAAPVVIEGVTVTLVLIGLGQPALITVYATTAVVYASLSRYTPTLAIAARGVSKANLDAQSQLADKLINYESIVCYGRRIQPVDATH
ncbi:ABC transporter transmembrane domain-containing protein [Roseateles sp. NT4]|uniref:ABC transporter transmembrane domain-containing protein n=1 Tax=Roseateles sp. NT4 TaxID=3453715 RepID=UPI003EED518C